MSNALDDLRDDMMAMADEGGGSVDEFDGLKFRPGFKTYVIRILPPQRMKEKRSFYATHSYNYINGEQLFSLKKFGGKINPIDVHVRNMYNKGRESGNKALENQANSIKRKRNYYMEILLLGIGEETLEEPKYQIMIDTTNRGLLTKKICLAMGVPFFKDVDDKWVDENTKKVDKDKEYVNLIDIKNGFDLKIKRIKTGENNWDIDFEITPLTKKGPRALTKKEVEIVKENRIDIFTMEEYVEDINVVNDALKSWLEDQVGGEETANVIDDAEDNLSIDDYVAEDEEVKVPKGKSTPKAAPKATKKEDVKKPDKKVKKEKEVGMDIDDDAEFESMLKDLEKDETSEE